MKQPQKPVKYTETNDGGVVEGGIGKLQEIQIGKQKFGRRLQLGRRREVSTEGGGTGINNFKVIQ